MQPSDSAVEIGRIDVGPYLALIWRSELQGRPRTEHVAPTDCNRRLLDAGHISYSTSKDASDKVKVKSATLSLWAIFQVGFTSNRGELTGWSAAGPRQAKLTLTDVLPLNLRLDSSLGERGKRCDANAVEGNHRESWGT
jgi:hypothetical protein